MNVAAPTLIFALIRIEETFIPWLEKTTQVLLPFLPSPPTTFKIYEGTAIPPPIYHLRFLDSDGPINGKETEELETEEDALDPGWIWAKLEKNERVTDSSWFQDVRRIDLKLEDDAG
jgi:hypothetical protein